MAAKQIKFMNIAKKISKLFFLFAFIFVTAARAADILPAEPAEKEILNKFVSWDKNLKTLKLDYEQFTVFEDVPISSSYGRIYKKGNNIRVDVLENGVIGQSALTDKKIIKILDGKGKNITSLSWSEWYNSQPNKVLFDFGNYGKLLKEYKVKELAKVETGYKMILVPAHGQQYELEFTLAAEDYFPSAISISSEGVRTQTVLKNISKNIELEESIFK
jgi:outer membrane lipoprotein-sorting protein